MCELPLEEVQVLSLSDHPCVPHDSLEGVTIQSPHLHMCARGVCVVYMKQLVFLKF